MNKKEEKPKFKKTLQRVLLFIGSTVAVVLIEKLVSKLVEAM
ncbi:hypothetical protein [uncultured Microscilla sp.]|nr:hypothetical protein [uncultured Microscilla sp.]